MSTEVYEGPSGLACAVGVLPATVALFKTLRMAGRPLLDAHLRAKKIETTPDKLDKGIGYAIAATIYHLHSLNSLSYIISTVHALTNAGFSTYKLMRGAGIATLQPSTWLCRYHAIGTIGYSFLRCRSCAHPGLVQSYMLEDLWDFRHEWREQLIYVFHHVRSLAPGTLKGRECMRVAFYQKSCVYCLLAPSGKHSLHTHSFVLTHSPVECDRCGWLHQHRA